MVNFTSTKDSASFLVSTTDREGRMLRVDLLPAPLPRQLTLNVVVVGKKADERLSLVYGRQLVRCILMHVASLLSGTHVCAAIVLPWGSLLQRTKGSMDLVKGQCVIAYVCKHGCMAMNTWIYCLHVIASR